MLNCYFDMALLIVENGRLCHEYQYAIINSQVCVLEFRKIIQIMAWPNEYIVVSCFEINYKQYVISDFIV